MTKLKNTINVERAKLHITQEELADAVDVSRQAIHQIETEKSIPSTLLALKISKFFKVKCDDIFKIEEGD